MDVIFITIELYVAICMIVIISVLFIVMIIRDIRFQKLENKRAIELVRSRVMGKREEQAKFNSPNVSYFVVFEVRGELLDLEVLAEQQFRELRIGQKGLLQYQRKNQTLLYIHFDCD